MFIHEANKRSLSLSLLTSSNVTGFSKLFRRTLSTKFALK